MTVSLIELERPRGQGQNVLSTIELIQPAVVKQLRGRGPLPRIPLQGTLQEVEELRDRGPFLDAIFERDCVDSSVHPFSFEESAYLCGKYWAVLTFLIEEGSGLSAELKEALRGNTNASDHRLDRSAFVSIAEKVLGKEKFPDLEISVNDYSVARQYDSRLTRTPKFQTSILWSHAAPRMISGAR